MAEEGKKLKTLFYHWLFGIPLALVYLIGETIYKNHDLSGITTRLPRFLAMLVLGGAAVGAAVILLYRGLAWVKRLNVWMWLERVLAWRYIYLGIWLLLTAVYMICFLAYYPGTFAYDMPAQTWQAYGETEYTTYQPVMHTLLWAFFVRVGERLNHEALALVFYSIFELICVTAVSTIVIAYVNRITRNGYAVLITFLYYLLVPTLHLMSFSTTKDILYACFFTLFMMSLYEGTQVESQRNTLAIVIFGILSCLFRNNMIYVVVVMLAVSAAFRCPRKFGIFLLAIIAIYGCIVKAIFPMAGVEEGPRSEMLSVPISQLSGMYVEHPELLNEEERETILAYMPDAEAFNCRIADGVKSSFEDDLLKEDPGKFLKTYFQIMRKAPVEYLCFFLDLNVNYWYPGASVPDEYARRAYIETSSVEKVDFFVASSENHLPAVRAFYDKVADHTHWSMNIPGVKYFYSLAFPFMTLIFCLYLTVRNRNRSCILTMTMLVALFLTYLLGPVSIFRYLYPYYFSMPLYFGMAAKKDAERQKG